MPAGNVFRGKLDAAGQRWALVVSRYNEFITAKLTDGATDALLRNGAAPSDIDTFYAPGAFELPVVVQALVRRGGYAAVIALGCVIRGETPHFDYVAGAAADGALQAALASGTPVAFGVITADTLEQATERAGGKVGNKGSEAALAAIETATLLQTIANRAAPGTMQK